MSCNSNKTITVKAVSQANENLLEKNNITNIITSNHENLINTKGDLESFRSYIKNLDNTKVSTIPLTLDYIKTCISPDLSSKDSVFKEFYFKFYSVANGLSDAFESKYPQLVNDLNENKNNQETEAFLDNIKIAGLDLCMSEGMYYFDVKYDYFYNNFKDRVSPDLSEYLNIRKDEVKQGFSEDAGMLISFEELYKRVKRWEDFLTKYPNSSSSEEATYFYQTYLETLLTGMDNTRTFDFENNTLIPEVKTIFERVIQGDSTSNTGKVIKAYYKFLLKNNFIYSDSISVFLESFGLSSMLGVQPHNR
jgi:hypothetical protein